MRETRIEVPGKSTNSMSACRGWFRFIPQLLLWAAQLIERVTAFDGRPCE
jgi:hypothetical protein